MRKSYLVSILQAFLFIPSLTGQNIHEIVVKKQAPDTIGIPLCYSSCNECGKLIFITFISNLKFESSLSNIKDQRVDTEVNPNGYEKFTYHVVTKAMRIQHITIKGPNVAEYDLTVLDLKPLDCQEFLINFVPTVIPIGSFFLTSIPAGATITINGEPQVNQVTPCNLKDHPTGTFSVRLAKAGYVPVDTLITIRPKESAEMIVVLKPVQVTNKPKDVKSIATESPEDLQIRIKKHGRNQTWWLTSTLVTGGVGGYFMYTADQKYQEYLKSTDSQAAELHKTFALYDKLGPAILGLAGVCALEFTIQSVKKGKYKNKLKIQTNGLSTKLTFNF